MKIIIFFLLKAKGKNGNFSTCDALLWEGLQRLEKLEAIYLRVLNVDPYSPIDASWRINT